MQLSTFSTIFFNIFLQQFISHVLIVGFFANISYDAGPNRGSFMVIVQKFHKNIFINKKYIQFCEKTVDNCSSYKHNI